MGKTENGPCTVKTIDRFVFRDTATYSFFARITVSHNRNTAPSRNTSLDVHHALHLGPRSHWAWRRKTPKNLSMYKIDYAFCSVCRGKWLKYDCSSGRGTNNASASFAMVNMAFRETGLVRVRQDESTTVIAVVRVRQDESTTVCYS